MKVELRNEQYLDSLGAGTTDKVRQAELSYNTSRLELEQLKQQYANEKQIAAADLKVLELDLNMFRKGLAEMKRTLDDAQIRSPRKAILTYINNQIGAQIPQGGQVAIISDLSHFKVDGEIADTYGDRVAAGGKAIVKIGSGTEGMVGGHPAFEEWGYFILRAIERGQQQAVALGLNAISIRDERCEGRCAAHSQCFLFGSGRGEYDLFVMTSDDEIVNAEVPIRATPTLNL